MYPDGRVPDIDAPEPLLSFPGPDRVDSAPGTPWSSCTRAYTVHTASIGITLEVGRLTSLASPASKAPTELDCSDQEIGTLCPPNHPISRLQQFRLSCAPGAVSGGCSGCTPSSSLPKILDRGSHAAKPKRNSIEDGRRRTVAARRTLWRCNTGVASRHDGDSGLYHGNFILTCPHEGLPPNSGLSHVPATLDRVWRQ